MRMQLYSVSTMKRIAALSIACISLTVAMASVSIAEPIGPRVKTQHEIFDFGSMPQNARVTHVFWLHSTGDQELVIEKLVPNCGCTEAPLEKTHVPPGDSTRVELTFGSGRFHGPVTKFTQIVSNSTGRAPALTFKANVVSDTDAVGPILLKPDAVRLDDERIQKSDAGYHYSVSLVNSGKEAVTLTLADIPDRDVRLDLSGPLTLQPGESREVTLAFDDDLPSQLFSRSVSFDISSKSQPRVTLPVFKLKPWDDSETSGS